LFAFTLVYLALRNNRDFLAGMALGMALLKPQLVLVMALVMLYRQRWRAILGLSVTGLLLLVISLLTVGINGIRSYLALTRQMGAWQGMYSLSPGPMSNVRGTVYRLGQLYQSWGGSQLSPTLLTALTALLSALLLVLVLRVWRRSWDPASPAFDLQFSHAVIGSLLLSPHLYDHDLILLVLVGVLLYRYASQATSVAVRAMIPLGHWAPVASVAIVGIAGIAERAQVLALLLLAFLFILQDELNRAETQVWQSRGG